MDNRVVVELTNDDMVKLYGYLRSLDAVPLKKRLYQFTAVTAIAVVIVVVTNLGSNSGMLFSIFLILGIIGALALLMLMPEIIHRLTAPFTKKALLKQSKDKLQIEGTRQYILKEKGIEVKTSYGDMLIGWNEIDSFKNTDEDIYFNTTGSKGAHIIPLKYFTSKKQARSFEGELAERFYRLNEASGT